MGSTEDPTQGQDPVQEQEPAQGQKAAQGTEPVQEQEPRKKKTGRNVAIVIIIIAVVVVVVVLAMWMRSRNRRADREELAETTEVTEVAEAEPEQVTADEEEIEPEETAAEETAPEEEEEAVAGDYILPESDSRYYTEAELAGLSKAELRIARNEIYARHGRKFDSQDLQEYFDAQPWYKGTVDPGDFSMSVFNEYELANISTIEAAEDDATGSVTGTITDKNTDTSDATFEASWETIKEYGFDFDEGLIFGDYHSDKWNYSVLSFAIAGGTAVDCGDYYTVQAVFSKPLRVPADPEVGDTYTAVINELTGETETFTYVKEEGTGATYYRENGGGECYLYNVGSDGMAELMEDSADRIDVPFYQGVLRISKEAVTGDAVLRGPYNTVTASDFADDDWFNAVAFDDDGYVMQLIYVGD